MSVRRLRTSLACPKLVWLIAVALLTTGCSHTLEVKNIGLYKPEFVSTPPNPPLVGLSMATSSPEEERLVMAVANALKRDGFKITYPFYPTEENLRSVDYLVKLTTSSQYKGSGWNFLINWPGFVLWTPAWYGYKYRVVYGFDADITDTRTSAMLPRLSMPVDLDIRHADLGRTWTEVSWLEWSAIAFIGGLIFTRYDADITPELVDRTEQKIANYVASKIAVALTSNQNPVANSS
jgi:hypothetical protein